MSIWNKIKTVFSSPAPVEAAATAPAITPTPSPIENTKHTRSDAEKALIADFRTVHADLIENLEDAVYSSNQRMKKAEDPTVKADLCRKTISAYEKLRTVCHNTGPGGALYFTDMWEHCSNSSTPDFRFIDPVEEILRGLTE